MSKSGNTTIPPAEAIAFAQTFRQRLEEGLAHIPKSKLIFDENIVHKNAAAGEASLGFDLTSPSGVTFGGQVDVNDSGLCTAYIFTDKENYIDDSLDEVVRSVVGVIERYVRDLSSGDFVWITRPDCWGTMLTKMSLTGRTLRESYGVADGQQILTWHEKLA